ncbi:MAG TPA: hypothetical protein VFO38_01205 [Candidatus Saccharimonadales bacterium]|nr:hypothetical protein [Candidatus Saccharimonadales bacterium]
MTLGKKISALLAALAFVITVPLAASAGSSAESLCTGSGGKFVGGTCTNNPDSLNTQPSVMTTIKNVTNLLVFVVGAIAVIMIIIGGIRYVTSAGEQAAITGAKNTILYAIVGVIVAIAAYAIVNFVTTFVK